MGVSTFYQSTSLQSAKRRAASSFSLPERVWSGLAPCSGGLAGRHLRGYTLLPATAPPQAPATNCRVALICERRERVLPDAYSVVFQQGTYRNELENLKTGNYWPNITALSGAVKLGANEALLLNSHDRLVGCAMANVFLKIRGRWCTPCPEDGARRGVVREWAKGAIEVHSQSISRKEIDAASELFLTSSWIGVMPVTSLEGRSLERSAEIEDLRARLERFCADRSEEPAASTRSSP